MPKVSVPYTIPRTLLLGRTDSRRVPQADQQRQRAETEEILRRLRNQPGVILGDEVGMGKTFVALSVAYAIAVRNPRGPVVIMVPPNIVDKWEQDVHTFCELYVKNHYPLNRDSATPAELSHENAIRYGVARHSVDFLKLLDDPKRIRCQIVFLAQGAMSRGQTNFWVRLALIRQTLRRYSHRKKLGRVKGQIHRFMGELLHAKGQQRASGLHDEMWKILLRKDPAEWMRFYNENLRKDRFALSDDPVPASVLKALKHVNLSSFADALERMPIRASRDTGRLSERVKQAREALRTVERDLWIQILVKARWRSPLLILDEAHHLKNPKTALARQLQSIESDEDLTMRVGDGALSRAFDRMLFLTATPFQLGHRELVKILQRFGDVRWKLDELGEKERFSMRLERLTVSLDNSQRAAIRLQRAWSKLSENEGAPDCSSDEWWLKISGQENRLSHRENTLKEAFEKAREYCNEAERLLLPWIVRHNKGETWEGTHIARRQRVEGAAVRDGQSNGGIRIPEGLLLPFFLAARSATDPGKDLLGEALCSSYEAFRYTRKANRIGKDDTLEDEQESLRARPTWFLSEFDKVIDRHSGAVHPKLNATVQRAVDLWEDGEKVLIFAFYRQTCRALRIHLSKELDRRLMTHARRRFAGAGRPADDDEIERIIASIHNRYFDTPRAPGRRALDRALGIILSDYEADVKESELEDSKLIDVMRRFLRVRTTLVRAFPIHQHDKLRPHLAVRSMLDSEDATGLSWRNKFNTFLHLLLREWSVKERMNYLEAVQRTQTGSIRVQAKEESTGKGRAEEDGVRTLPNIQIASGETPRSARGRLMRAFNTPFFPDILVCSQVMGEGVDLQRFCRHVIHHDLAWNPSSIEQRTGRVDRLGCKAEYKESIPVYLPYMSGTADERQYVSHDGQRGLGSGL